MVRFPKFSDICVLICTINVQLTLNIRNMSALHSIRQHILQWHLSEKNFQHQDSSTFGPFILCCAAIDFTTPVVLENLVIVWYKILAYVTSVGVVVVGATVVVVCSIVDYITKCMLLFYTIETWTFSTHCPG